MGLIPNFTAAAIRKEMDRRFAAIEDSMIERLRYLGEQCANKAREDGSYRDYTGNLRNSVGYIVVANGNIVVNELDLSGDGNVSDDAVAAQLRKYKTGYALLVVAGMNYADAVEAKGRIVLSSAELFAEEEMPKMLAKLKSDINQL